MVPNTTQELNTYFTKYLCSIFDNCASRTYEIVEDDKKKPFYIRCHESILFRPLQILNQTETQPARKPLHLDNTIVYLRPDGTAIDHFPFGSDFCSVKIMKM